MRSYSNVMSVIFFAIWIIFFSSFSWAEEVLIPLPSTVVLSPVIVSGKIDPTESLSPWYPTVDQDVIQQIPSGNGSLNEILRILPGLQLSEEYNSAQTGGEILPPKISISGGKVYQNNFLVDGIANNNLIDPEKGSVDNIADAPGYPQERFLNSDLIESVNLYDSNVPARFGGFTGGVVEAKTRNPGKDVKGHFAYRTTRDQWTEFHLSEKDQSNFATGGSSNLQPQFTKNDYGATFSFPLTEKSGILTSWHQLDSRIPVPYFLGSKTQKRRQQSYFIKYVGEVFADDHFEFSLSSTPYREERFDYNVLDSDYVLKMEGLSLQGEWEHFFPFGQLQINGAYRLSTNNRTGPQHRRIWSATDSKDWGRLIGSKVSMEGGFGSIEKNQESFDLKGLFRLDPIFTGTLRHELTSGMDLNRTIGSFERQGTTYFYTGKVFLSPEIICGENNFDCVEGEQFFTERRVYDAEKSRADINQVALHSEDFIKYRRLELRPGLRFDYNDLMKETNLSPRFSASYDLFGGGATVLHVGANRYYGSTLLTDKLREAKIPFRTESRTLSEVDNQPLPWQEANGRGASVTRFEKLKTPYADEVSVGFEQQIAGGVFNFQYLRREGRDEFARTYTPGVPYYVHTLNNLGKSHHERYRLGWQRNWTHYFFYLNASLQETTTTNEGYDTPLDSEDIEELVWYENKLIRKSDLPAFMQNRPVIVNLIWVAELPARFTFTNFSRYRSAYREIIKTGNVEEIVVYEEIKHSGKVIFDWKLAWSTPVYRQQLLNFSLEVNNVFNSRTQTGGSTTTYEMGRQFWAGVAYDF